MKIIIAPAKQMTRTVEFPEPKTTPFFSDQAKILLDYIRSLSYSELKTLLECNDKIASLNFERYKTMYIDNLIKGGNAAILSYDGIQYKYMAPRTFESSYFNWVQKHVRIISGFYGILRPLDGVVPYRLEMRTKLKTAFCRNLYDFWGNSICSRLIAEEKIDNPNATPFIVNLASAEYSRAVEPYLPEKTQYLTCLFGELENGTLREKGVYVKMARGEMIRYLAETGEDGDESRFRKILSSFNRLGFRFNADLSNEKTFAFTIE